MEDRTPDSVNETDASEANNFQDTFKNASRQTKKPSKQFHEVYEDTMYFIDGMVKQFDYYPDIMDAFRNGKAKIELKKRFMLKAIDEKWVEKIEDCLPALDAIIRNPSKFIQETETVMPIELSRNISSRSIQHLSQHTDYISKVEGDNITPSKILNVFRDETMLTYENKFVNTLINRLYIFVTRRYETARNEGNDEKVTKLDFSEEFVHNDAKGKINFNIEISEEPEPLEVLKNYTYTTDLWRRVVRLNEVCNEYIHSSFVRNMGQNFVRPPIIRTNALLKNQNLRRCLELWEYIVSYENIGYEMLLQEDLETVDERYVRALYSSAALQYLIFRYNIRNEFLTDKTLATRESDAPLSPVIVDEFDPFEASEFDKKFGKEAPSSDSEDSPMPLPDASFRSKMIRNAVDVALAADAIMKNDPPYQKPPRRDTAKSYKRIVVKAKNQTVATGKSVKKKTPVFKVTKVRPDKQNAGKRR